MGLKRILVILLLIAPKAFATDDCGLRYPKDARKLGAEGTVTLSVDVDKDGNVTHAEVIENTGRLESFATEALRIVKCIRFRPATDNGVPVEQKGWKMKLNFSCHDKETGASNCDR